MAHVSGPVGNLIHTCMYSVSSRWFSDNPALERLIDSALEKEDYGIITRHSEPFDGDLPAFSGIRIISESHLGYHTYAEHGSIDLTLNTCRENDSGWFTIAHIVAAVKPEVLRVFSFPIPLRLDLLVDYSGDSSQFFGRAEGFFNYFRKKIERCGGNVEELLKGYAR